jgi:hypothetical protein
VAVRPFVAGEGAAEQRRHAERREEGGRNVQRDDLFGCARAREIDAVVVERRDALEGGALQPADDIGRRQCVPDGRGASR